MKKKKSVQERCRGVISIFLAIVLVPCMVFVCAFADVSRVMLSKSQAVAASDLALYSLMSNYDKDLEQFYGMVASCQDVDKYYDACEEYFTGMMSASGLSNKEVTLFSDYIKSLRSGNNQITDFLQVNIKTEPKIEAVPNSQLGSNPALLEDQIVEFMKYRGPVELVVKIVDKLKQIDILSTVEDVSEDEKIVEAKQKYAEAEGELLEAALYSYIAIRDYDKAQQQEKIPDFSAYMNYTSEFKKVKTDFESVTDLITKYYAPTKGIKYISFPVHKLNAFHYSASQVGKKVTTPGGTVYCLTKKKLEALLKDIEKYCSAVEQAQQNIVNACKDIPTPDGSDVNEAIYCMKIQAAVSSSDLSTMQSKGKELMQRYAQMKTALDDCVPHPTEDDLPEEWEKQLEDAMKSIQSVQSKYYSLKGSSSYSKLITAYCSTAPDVISKVKNRSYQFHSQYLNKDVTIGDFVSQVSANYSHINEVMTKQIQRLTICIDGGKVESVDGKKHSVPSMKKLKKLIREYKTTRTAWGNAANQGSSEFAQSEQEEYKAEIKDANGQYNKEANQSAQLAITLCELGEDAVNVLNSRLTNIRNDMKNFQSALQKFTYGKKSVLSLTTSEVTITAGCTVIESDQSIHLSENHAAAQGYCSKLIAPSGDVYTYPERKLERSGNIPSLKDEDFPPDLYRYMKDKFKDENLKEIQDEVDENDKRNEDYEKQKKEAKKGAITTADPLENDEFLLGVGKDFDSETCVGGATANAISAVKGIVDSVRNITTGHSDEIRDKLYVCEYAMDMFSYSSFNNEGQYKLSNSNGTAYKYEDFSGRKYPNYDTWKNTSATANKIPNQYLGRNPYLSLTNQPINAENNRANLAEVEYLLYGNADISQNLERSYKSIMAIREALNLVAGFQIFYNRNDKNPTAVTINNIAFSVMTLTQGIVPECLTKCILIGVVSTMESAQDMKELKAGVPITFYKNKQDASQWYYSLSLKGGEPSTGNKTSEDKNGLYYSDYIYIFLVAGTGNTSTYEAMLKRIGYLVETNMQKRLNKSDYTLNKSVCYFKMTAELEVKPLLLALPIVDNTVGSDTAKAVRKNKNWCTYSVNVVRGYS